MKRTLSLDEHHILAALQERPGATAVELARLTKRTVSTVQYTLKKFHELHGVQVRPAVNSYLLGVQNVALYFTPVFSDDEARRRLDRILAKHPKIPWACEFIGEYQYGVTVHCRYISEVAKVVEELCDKGRMALAGKQISPRICYRYFGRGYLSGARRKHPILEHQYHHQEADLDALDLRILRVLSNENFRSMRDAARIVGMPSSTFDQRIRRLVKQGIISGDIVQFSPALVGYTTHRLMLETQMFSEEDAARFRGLCLQLPEVVAMNETLGTFDREVIVEVAEVSELSRLLGEFYRTFGPKIRSSRTLTEARIISWRLF
jgi:Lrp/AsnC family leucine-responsive transcriptional regulator